MPRQMRAMVLEAPRTQLRAVQLPVPKPGRGQVLLRVLCCGVCRTDLHVLDGEHTQPKLPLILGHQIVGTIEQLGAGVEALVPGQRVGVPWLGRTCGECRACRAGRENVCERAMFTGYDLDGGYAALTLADCRFALPLPGSYVDLQAAPLLCAGLIGYRALRMTGEAERLALYGFGSAAHIIAQVARYEGRKVFALTRPGDSEGQQFALELGAAWVGGSDEAPPEQIDAAIIFAPAGALVPAALRTLAPGGTVVCAGISMTDIPSFPYESLWHERSVRSVANLTRRDGIEFLELAPRVPVRTRVTTYPLEQANQALDDLRAGKILGSAVLEVA